MPVEPTTPKYAEIINAMQTRIERQAYRAGDMLPSEADLVREFSTSRSTVVRALEYLRQHGWVQGIQGKGRVVLPRPTLPTAGVPARIHRLLDPDVQAGVTLLGVGPVRAPRRVASALSIPSGGQLVARYWRATAVGVTPSLLATAYFPANLTVGTDLATPGPVVGGLLAHLQHRRGVTPQRVLERIGARPSSAQEATRLRLDQRVCLVTVLLTVLDRADRPLLAVDAVMPAESEELTAVYAPI